MRTNDTMEKIEADRDAGGEPLMAEVKARTAELDAAKVHHKAVRESLTALLSSLAPGVLTKDEAIMDGRRAVDLPKHIDSVIVSVNALERVLTTRVREAWVRMNSFADGVASRIEALEAQQAADVAAKQAQLDTMIEALRSSGLTVVPDRSKAEKPKGSHLNLVGDKPKAANESEKGTTP